ncbi:UNVERIFIED_ORG: hypothetical protein J2X79_000860 [Arthrobacter globiformis]|nr:hypothetical protein [Arthrobacter globiformis]
MHLAPREGAEDAVPSRGARPQEIPRQKQQHQPQHQPNQHPQQDLEVQEQQ